MLRDWNSFVKYLRSTIETHQLMYDFEYDVQEEIYKYETFRDQLLSDEMGGGIGSGGCIIDGVQYVNQKYNEGKNIITRRCQCCYVRYRLWNLPICHFFLHNSWWYIYWYGIKSR